MAAPGQPVPLAVQYRRTATRLALSKILGWPVTDITDAMVMSVIEAEDAEHALEGRVS